MQDIINKKIDILDHGFVRVVDVMGDDKAIENAARVSYGGHDQDRTEDDTRNLIRFLTSHNHSSPVEMCEIKLHIKAPLFTAVQWIRHRTANVNQKSARYTVVKDEFYIPELSRYVKQSKTNKQCSDFNNTFSAHDQLIFDNLMRKSTEFAKENYDYMIEKGVSREVARIQLPQNQYVEFFWKIDTRNLLNFVNLRSASDAQWEIQEYSKVIEGFVKQWIPITYEAFVDYVKDSYTLSRMALNAVKRLLAGDAVDLNNCGMSKREVNEFRKELGL